MIRVLRRFGQRTQVNENMVLHPSVGSSDTPNLSEDSNLGPSLPRWVAKTLPIVPTLFWGTFMVSHATFAAGVGTVTPISVQTSVLNFLTWATGLMSTALGGYAAIHFFAHSGRLMSGAHNPQKRQLAIEGFGWTGLAAVIGFGITAVLGILDGVSKHL